jgi:hypothetical protein
MYRTAGNAIARLGADDRAAMRHLAAAALVTHGLFHVMGVTLIWNWNGPADARFPSLTPTPGSTPAVAIGSAWLIAGALFVTAGLLLSRGHRTWRASAAAAVAVSAPALLPFSDGALYGLFADAAVVVALVLTRQPSRRPR